MKKFLLALALAAGIGAGVMYYNHLDRPVTNKQASFMRTPPTVPPQPTVLLNCDSSLTITIPDNSADGITQYQIVVSGGSGDVLNTIVPANAGGNTVLNTGTLPSPVFISPSTSQYSVTIGRLNASGTGGLYPYNSIMIIWTDYLADGSAVGVPAKLGYLYTYYDGVTQVVSCPTQSASTFITTSVKGNQGKGNGKGKNGK